MNIDYYLDIPNKTILKIFAVSNTLCCCFSINFIFTVYVIGLTLIEIQKFQFPKMFGDEDQIHITAKNLLEIIQIYLLLRILITKKTLSSLNCFRRQIEIVFCIFIFSDLLSNVKFFLQKNLIKFELQTLKLTIIGNLFWLVFKAIISFSYNFLFFYIEYHYYYKQFMEIKKNNNPISIQSDIIMEQDAYLSQFSIDTYFSIPKPNQALKITLIIIFGSQLYFFDSQEKIMLGFLQFCLIQVFYPKKLFDTYSYFHIFSRLLCIVELSLLRKIVLQKYWETSIIIILFLLNILILLYAQYLVKEETKQWIKPSQQKKIVKQLIDEQQQEQLDEQKQQETFYEDKIKYD